MAKSEMRAMHMSQAIKNLMYQRAGLRENDFAISIIFGEHQVMAQLIATRVLISPLINKAFPVRHPLLARGNLLP
jgi:hypothetical protein